MVVGPTMAAAAFLDTAGIGAHWEYGDTVYGTHRAELVEVLAGSGLRLVRGYDPEVSERLAERGLRSTHVAGPEYGSPEETADLIARANRRLRVVDAVEGPNESDLFWTKHDRAFRGLRFPEGVLAYQRELYRAIKGRRDTAGTLVIGPSLGRTYLRDSGRPNPFPDGSLTEAVDLGNFHPYPFGGNSFSIPFRYGTIERYYWHGNFPSTNLDEFPYNFLVYAPPFRPKPMAASETGYHTGPEGVSEAVHARYIPRLFAEYARLGIRRTYLYELADLPTAGPVGGHFGLLRGDASPKPGFVALRSLLRLIGREAQEGAAPGPVVAPELVIEPRMPPGYDRTRFVHSLVLQAAPSRYLLLLWHEVANADTSSKPAREILVADGSAVIALPEALRASACYAYDPGWELRRQPLDPAASRVEVPLRDSIVVVALGPAPAMRQGAMTRRGRGVGSV
ncbi:MAG TPA: hypothetical protein VE684_03775, partial [Crenalkalicoccus sp.]|nr:hypothetical protein [Crenalkalicoccus sp.]